MRRRGGIVSQIMGIIFILILLGLALAVLRQFDWDFGAVITWTGEKIVEFVDKIANYFTSLPTFRKLFGS